MREMKYTVCRQKEGSTESKPKEYTEKRQNRYLIAVQSWIKKRGYATQPGASATHSRTSATGRKRPTERKRPTGIKRPTRART
jgi:hypothetical protein